MQLPPVDPQILETLLSPSLLVFAERVRANIRRMITIAGDKARLRPHCKTHKMPAVIEILLSEGVLKHKAATVAEAEMLLDCGVRDVLLAYNPVGPNIDRVVHLCRRFPDARLSVTADHMDPLQKLADACAAAAVNVGVMLDIDVGQGRTGVSPDSDTALQLYQFVQHASALIPSGFHVYDGHQHQTSVEARREAVLEQWSRVVLFRDRCASAGSRIPEILCGGTPTFPIYAELPDSHVTLSPGTCVLHDAGYGAHFPDLKFQPAAAVVTRVVSCPGTNRITVDLGNKSVAADPPEASRIVFPQLGNVRCVMHNEEHLVVETETASDLLPGSVLLGIPIHICPTVALHSEASVLDGDRLVNAWPVTARDRRLTV